jgi:hypothetical protein
MRIENTTERIIKAFNRGIFPQPHEFTDTEIDAIATIPGTDSNGTFADGPMERSLMRSYGMDGYPGANTWPALASDFREEKSRHLAHLTFKKEYALKVQRLKDAIARYEVFAKISGG